MKKLNRKDLEKISGGFFAGTCVAGCGRNEDGTFESTVVCVGSNCSAVDEVGCEADGGPPTACPTSSIGIK